MYKKVLLVTVMVFLFPILVFPDTPFERNKKVKDPYIAENGGVGSLYVNPAGAAGESGFDLNIRGEMSTTKDSQIFFDRMAAVTKAFLKVGGIAEDTDEMSDEVKQARQDFIEKSLEAIQYMFAEDSISKESIQAIFEGTVLSPDADVDWSNWQEVVEKSKEIDDIEDLFSRISSLVSGESQPFFQKMGEKKSLKVLADVRLGFLIKGFGLGTYIQAHGALAIDPSPVPSENFYGLESVYTETGLILGGGFPLFDGRLSLGITGDYRIFLGNVRPVNIAHIGGLFTGGSLLAYGISWGIDVGAIWRPLPDLSVGLVLNNLIGTTEALGDRSTDMGLDNLFSKLFSESFEYRFMPDVDLGITWHPSWRYIDTSFSMDFYDLVSYIRDAAEAEDNFEDLMGRTLNHMRLGVNASFFDFLKTGLQFYKQYISFGIGMDMLFLELYGEYSVHKDVIFSTTNPAYKPFKASISARIHF